MKNSALIKFRKALNRAKLDGFVLPHQDMYQAGYLVPRDEWLFWLTGFSGSAGLSIVLKNKAALFVDGRYTIQARQQVNEDFFELHNLGDEIEWIRDNAGSLMIGFNPWTMTASALKRFSSKGFTLVPQAHFLDDLWQERPPHPKAPLALHPVKFAGVDALDKVKMLQEILSKEEVDGFLLPPKSWSWLLNVRGQDLTYTPISQGFAWITQKRVDLFLHNTNTPPLPLTVFVHPIEALEDELKMQKHLTLGYDATHTPYAVYTLFEKRILITDPCVLPKACKNSIEIEGSKSAHKKDAAAWYHFWDELKNSLAINSPLTELDIVAMMLEGRKKQPLFRSQSFATIAGSGPNGAIIHYKPEESTNRILKKDELLLIDSGGQYDDGTTDITRTLILGHPTDAMRHHYTCVLKGHIALASTTFPKGTTGAQLDVLARSPLWNFHLDYPHGTGHGVGSFLSVHEGPQHISKTGHEPLRPGMILSNEPGYYLEGEYGIRLENLMVVVSLNENWLAFETLTLVPFDNRLIDKSLLSRKETVWLDDYHRRCLETIPEFKKFM